MMLIFIWYEVGDPTSFFCMWLFSCPKTLCVGDFSLSYQNGLDTLVENQLLIDTCLLLDSQLYLLNPVFILTPILCYLDYQSFVISFEMRKYLPISFQHYFALGPLEVHMDFGSSFHIFAEETLGFL